MHPDAPYLPIVKPCPLTAPPHSLFTQLISRSARAARCRFEADSLHSAARALCESLERSAQEAAISLTRRCESLEAVRYPPAN